LYQIGLDDEAKALIDLEGKYKNNEIESLTSGQTKLEKHNIHTTIKFVDYLKDNGYSVSEKQLGLFRFTTNITSNSFSNSNGFRVLLYFFNASEKSSSSEW
jgi:hypothetical protein